LRNGKNGHRFDMIHVEHLRGVPFALKAKEASSDIPVVWDSVDCISLLFRKAAVQSKRRINRLITSLELHRTEDYERWLVGQFDHTLVTSQEDRRAFFDLGLEPNSANKISVLPNGVDLDYFDGTNALKRQEDTILMSGKMSYHANVTMVTYFIETIWPKILLEKPDAKLWIVGKDPTPDILALGEKPGITVTGYVKDIRPYLYSATVAVAPVKYGVGIQNKVLEAMACATPVVATRQAISALQTEPNRDLMVSDDPDQFAREVLRLLGDENHRRQVGQAGLAYVQANHKWSAIAERLEGIYHEVIH